jgi:UDP-N-acetylmuramate: L-alanyl-gamma-D-glutamyl-meso-diaminopimelate ligase
VLDRSGIQADRMIGATIGQLEPVTVTDAPVIVLEGDEYLSSPMDPRAKFLHYDPDIAIITGIAWDHMNVFPTHDAYIAPFRELIESMRPGSTLIYCADDPELVELVERTSPKCQSIAYHAVAR